MPASVYAAIEAGGNKFVCGVGMGIGDLRTIQVPTRGPQETVAAAVAWIRREAGTGLAAVGIGSFGPVELNRESPCWGHITSTPKIAWRHFDLAGEVSRALGVPVAFDTDVNAAALGELRWGEARGLTSFLYMTVGTGIGAGGCINGRFLHGLSHPEMGHIRVPHDRAVDPFPGICPYHGDCLEGLASGPAIEARWGKSPADLRSDHPAWALEAQYLALGIANFCCVLSPRRLIVGGGVMRQTTLYERVSGELSTLLGGYVPVPPIVAPGLGRLSGVLGALALAQSLA